MGPRGYWNVTQFAKNDPVAAAVGGLDLEVALLEHPSLAIPLRAMPA